VPRRIDVEDDDEMPRRRRRAKAVAVEPEEERGLVMRMLLYSPKDMIAGVLAAAAISAIIANALFLQAGRHPSPMFGTVTTMPAPAPSLANPLPRPRPAEATRMIEPLAPPEPTRSVETRSADPKHADSRNDHKNDSKNDPMANLVVKSTATATAPSSVARPPASIPSRGEAALSPTGRRIAGVQRALTEYGYGQLKPTGTIGADTQAAIAKFERDRKLPVTGQMSDRLVRELTAMTGRPID
jgi:Putative peptidoglycan binding domain